MLTASQSANCRRADAIAAALESMATNLPVGPNRRSVSMQPEKSTQPISTITCPGSGAGGEIAADSKRIVTGPPVAADLESRVPCRDRRRIASRTRNEDRNPAGLFRRRFTGRAIGGAPSLAAGERFCEIIDSPRRAKRRMPARGTGCGITGHSRDALNHGNH